jgi:hypothetical protein
MDAGTVTPERRHVPDILEVEVGVEVEVEVEVEVGVEVEVEIEILGGLGDPPSPNPVQVFPHDERAPPALEVVLDRFLGHGALLATLGERTT